MKHNSNQSNACLINIANILSMDEIVQALELKIKQYEITKSEEVMDRLEDICAMYIYKRRIMECDGNPEVVLDRIDKINKAADLITIKNHN